MNDFRTFHAPKVALPALVEAVAQWYQGQNFEIQTAPAQGGMMLQARQAGDWRKAFGTSSALQMVFRTQGEDLVVEMGAGKWSDKAAAGAVGWFLLWPLAFTAAYGAWQQSKLPDRTFEFVERYLAGGTQVSYGGPPAPPAVAAAASAPAAPVPASTPTAAHGAGFCSRCGAALAADALFCQKCGAKVAA